MFLHQSLLGMAMARYDKVWQGVAWEAGRTSLREMFKRPIAGETPPRQNASAAQDACSLDADSLTFALKGTP